MINSFLLIGQSNMSGRGRLFDVDKIVNENVFMFRHGKWVIAKEPIHRDKIIAGVGLAVSFADRLQKKYNKQIGLIPCAYGGSSLDEWKKGEKLYNNAYKAAAEAQKTSVIKGILWHQGEEDSDKIDDVMSYENRFTEMISSLKSDLGINEIPIIVGELGSFLKTLYWKDLNEVLNSISKNNAIEPVSAYGLLDRGDNLHFNSVSLREFGFRYAEAWETCSQRLRIYLE